MFLSIFCCPAQCFRGLVSGGVFGGFWGGGSGGGHDSVHVRMNFLSSALMTHVCALGSLAHCLMSGFFCLLGCVCCVLGTCICIVLTCDMFDLTALGFMVPQTDILCYCFSFHLVSYVSVVLLCVACFDNRFK